MRPLRGRIKLDPSVVHICEECNEGIYPGDEYAKVNGAVYCSSCLEDMSAKEIVLLFGGEWKTADEDEIDDGSDDAYECWRDEVAFG